MKNGTTIPIANISIEVTKTFDTLVKLTYRDYFKVKWYLVNLRNRTTLKFSYLEGSVKNRQIIIALRVVYL